MNKNCDWTWYEWRVPNNYPYQQADFEVSTIGNMNTGAAVYIDGLVLSKDWHGYQNLESCDDNDLYKRFTYTTDKVYSSATILTSYDDFDIGCYNTTGTTTTVKADNVKRPSNFLPRTPGGQIYIDVSGLSTGAHQIDIATPFTQVGRYPSNGVLTWCGETWWARRGTGNPLNNSWASYGVYVDYKNRMHLTIHNISGVWKSTELDGETPYKYGNFTWTVESDAFNLDKNVVLGLYSYANDANENDIEITRWWDNANDNLWYSVQPAKIPGNSMSYNVANANTPVVCNFDWKPNYVHFRTWYLNNGTMIADYNNTNASAVSQMTQYLSMNLWLFGSPSNGQEIDVVIDNFSAKPYAA